MVSTVFYDGKNSKGVKSGRDYKAEIDFWLEIGNTVKITKEQLDFGTEIRTNAEKYAAIAEKQSQNFEECCKRSGQSYEESPYRNKVEIAKERVVIATDFERVLLAHLNRSVAPAIVYNVIAQILTEFLRDAAAEISFEKRLAGPNLQACEFIKSVSVDTVKSALVGMNYKNFITFLISSNSNSDDVIRSVSKVIASRNFAPYVPLQEEMAELNLNALGARDMEELPQVPSAPKHSSSSYGYGMGKVPNIYQNAPVPSQQTMRQRPMSSSSSSVYPPPHQYLQQGATFSPQKYRSLSAGAPLSYVEEEHKRRRSAGSYMPEELNLGDLGKVGDDDYLLPDTTQIAVGFSNGMDSWESFSKAFDLKNTADNLGPYNVEIVIRDRSPRKTDEVRGYIRETHVVKGDQKTRVIDAFKQFMRTLAMTSQSECLYLKSLLDKLQESRVEEGIKSAIENSNGVLMQFFKNLIGDNGNKKSLMDLLRYRGFDSHKFDEDIFKVISPSKDVSLSSGSQQGRKSVSSAGRAPGG